MLDSSNITSFQLEQERANVQRPFTLMVKVVGSVCNLDCDYCYYLEKNQLYREKPFSIAAFRMNETILEKVISNFIESQPQDNVHFVWHGGEPTLLGLDYFRHIVSLQKKFANGKTIFNALQTNGTLINDAWAEFLSQNRFLCGLSVDGPKKFHDKHRKNFDGKGSWQKAVNAAKFFQKHDTEFNTMAVVNASNVKEPLNVYRFLKELKGKLIQFTPIVERIATDETHLFSMVDSHYERETLPMTENVNAETWGNFLCTIFDDWVKHDVGFSYINIFESVFASYVHHPVNLCSMSKYCTDSLVVEHNGDVFSCDHYVFPEYKIGNILEQNLANLAKCNQQLFFEEDKFYKLSNECKSCNYINICGGDCPKNRIKTNQDGEKISSLCSGFLKFFKHSDPFFKMMANEFFHQRPPSNIMKIIKNQ